MEKSKKPSFETSMARIEEIVKTLEKGTAPLDESLALFEEGAKLIRACGALLDAAEQRVTRLSKGADGEPVETVFDGGEE
jgi:exodeoxyribonuclease VII small subunit